MLAQHRSQSTRLPAHRVVPRYSSNRLSSIRGIAAGREDAWIATIRDVSRRGIGLCDTRWFKVGTILVVEPFDTENPRPLLMCVKRAFVQADGYWSLGCELLAGLSYEGAEELRQSAAA